MATGQVALKQETRQRKNPKSYCLNTSFPGKCLAHLLGFIITSFSPAGSQQWGPARVYQHKITRDRYSHGLLSDLKAKPSTERNNEGFKKRQTNHIHIHQLCKWVLLRTGRKSGKDLKTLLRDTACHEST